MLYLRINVTDEKTTPAQLISKDLPSWVQEEFAKYIAQVLRNEYKKAIDKQRYRYRWKPLSFRYMYYKETYNLSLKIWEATGLLKNSIVYRKRNGYYMVGIDPYKKYKNGVRVLDVAKCMEYGTSRMPARPLFRPLFEYIRKNIRRYWDKFLKENHYDEFRTL